MKAGAPVAATPRGSSPQALSALYAQGKSAPDFSLAAFVHAHFDVVVPPPPATERPGGPRRALCQHIRNLWPQLLRRADAEAVCGSSLLPLPQPYVVPGGRFREMYGWDSYFTMLGLLEGGRCDLAEGMLCNVAYQIDTLGHMPNGNRSYLVSRSQPPFFHRMVALLHADSAAAGFARYLPQLRREHAFWMAGEATLCPGQASARVVRLHDGSLLNRYGDASGGPREESYREDMLTVRASRRPPTEVWRDLRAAAESGWDFSSRWCADPRDLASTQTTQCLPIDLNSLLWGLEDAIHQGGVESGDAAGAAAFALRTQARRAAIDRWMWSEAQGHFVDFQWAAQHASPALTAAALVPLYVGLANAAQARGTAAAAQAQLLRPHGLLTTTQPSGQQWDAPNGWAPLQWLAVVGLRRYGHVELARSIATRWLAMVQRVYLGTGQLLEKYDVCEDRPGGGGEYPAQDGFGWTNGVAAALAALYPETLITEGD